MASENIIIIDGQKFSFVPGETILQVAQRNEVRIPTLCHLKRASATGACKICLVEVEGKENPVQSCLYLASSNMVVKTDSPRVIEERRMNLERLMASGNHNCLFQDLGEDSWADFQAKALESEEHHDVCPAYGACRLQELAIEYRVEVDRLKQKPAPYPIENINPLIVRDFSRCILCGRCIKACNEIQVNNVIRFDNEDSPAKVVTKGDVPLKDSNCVFCGECVQACPVGALLPKNAFAGDRLPRNAERIRTTCTYCGVGCQIHLHVKGNRVIEVSGIEDVRPNYGSLCAKGRFGYDFIQDPARLTRPLIRKNGQLQETSWDEAMSFVAKELTRIKDERGPDSIGVLSSARITNEENYIAQKFTRAVIGTNNIDHCARL